mmetsp:Transcript_15003/g.60231  ORF Transcript_15003/g.60231 Transcript_15003/m.60231 type:complete len:246 (+) Transcript_15003:27-764(+)
MIARICYTIPTSVSSTPHNLTILQLHRGGSRAKKGSIPRERGARARSGDDPIALGVSSSSRQQHHPARVSSARMRWPWSLTRCLRSILAMSNLAPSRVRMMVRAMRSKASATLLSVLAEVSRYSTPSEAARCVASSRGTSRRSERSTLLPTRMTATSRGAWRRTSSIHVATWSNDARPGTPERRSSLSVFFHYNSATASTSSSREARALSRCSTFDASCRLGEQSPPRTLNSQVDAASRSRRRTR